MHTLGKVNGVQHLNLVLGSLQKLSALNEDAAFRIGYHIRAVKLHEVGFGKEAGFSASATADHKDIFIPCVLRLFGATGHHQPFRLRQQHIVFKHGVDKRLDVCGRPPACRAVLHALAVLLGVLLFGIDHKPDNDSSGNADQQVHRVEAGRGIFKGCGKALSNIQQLCGKVCTLRQPERLPNLTEQINKHQIREMQNDLLFNFRLHSSIPLSLFFTLSRLAVCLAASAFFSVKSLRIEGLRSLSSFFAENSRNAAVSTSASRPLKKTR